MVETPVEPLHNLPVRPNSFIGRGRECAEIGALLDRERLVTLMGTGGCGKTRLALEVAANRTEEYADGIWWVELAALTAPARLAQTVAHALGIREVPDQPILESLLAALRSRRLLIVLDNCEHLVSVCAELADAVLRSCARVQILATSREALGMLGETAWRVPSLAVPPADTIPSVDRASRAEAVALFVERAAAVRPGFTLTDETAATVAQICRRLDGIPLAIELAAARVRVLTPEQIAARLDDRFRLLTSGNRAGVARHQTLQALIEWGHALLSEREQVVFARLAVFSGGWSLDAAEVVGVGDEIAAHEVLDLLARLVDKSLVVVDFGARGAARYRLLETLRQYAWARLSERGAEPVRDRHARYCLDLAEQIESRLEGDDMAARLDQLEQEHDNLRAALHWFRARGDVAAGLRLGTALRLFWHLRGHLAEGREWLESFLALDPGVPAELRARALDASGFLARFQGRYALAEPLIRESLTLRRQLGNQQAVADALNNLGSILLAQGQYQPARALYDEGLTTYRETGNRQGIADSRSHLGLIAFYEWDLVVARAAHAESLALWQELGDYQGISWALYRLGDVCLAEGDLAGTRGYFAESLEMRRDMADQWGIAESLDGFAMLAAAEHQPTQALRLAGAASALCAAAGLLVAPVRRAQVDAALERSRQALGPAATAAWDSGHSLPLDDAVAEALAGEAPATVTGPDTTRAATEPRLTRREAEVAECLARGLSNREIAGALCISERTVERHVENILAKLDLHSRTQVAVWVAGHGSGARHSG